MQWVDPRTLQSSLVIKEKPKKKQPPLQSLVTNTPRLPPFNFDKIMNKTTMINKLKPIVGDFIVGQKNKLNYRSSDFVLISIKTIIVTFFG